MTKRRQTRSDTPEPSPRPTVTHLAIALATLALLGAGAGLAGAQSDAPAVSVSDAELSPSGTATVDVVLTSAPNGLAGYNIDLTVADPEVAHIESASYPDRFDLTTDPAIGDAGRTVTLEAADVGSTIDAGATDVTLATVEIAGDAPGEAELAVDLRQLDGNDGDRLTPAAQAGTLTVTGDSSPSDEAGADSQSASSAPGPVSELGGSAEGLPTGILALLAALAAVGVLSAIAIARRRS
ncbi:hypothetical protein GLW36_04900 [Halorubrum terrestre]|uniref:Cell surface protein n=1 Tax=Halorubrum distributum TaxID=29283 RepID=A0A6B1IBY3_9EURY|nr:hypothetical protein [Halorubrum terrestre]MYL15988.1 hypothetical protein [Halorubrum terrestre]